MAREFLSRIQNKRDTSANWTKNNPVILNGEIILVDTAEGELRAKIGDGTKTYTQLPFSDEALKSLINTVANNVADNTTARHSHSNKDVLDKITGIVTKDNINSPVHISDLVDYSGFQAGSQQIINQIPKKTSDLTNDSGYLTEHQSLSGLATESYVNTKVAGIVNSAPETLDTLNELATALGNDPNFATTMATELGKKVDKVTGKGLSTNDLTAALKANYDAAYTHSQSAHAPSNAERNVIVGIQKNGTDISVNTSTRKVNITVPTKTSELTNDSSFITGPFLTENEIDTICGMAVANASNLTY